MSNNKLSKSDERVLNLIFDAEAQELPTTSTDGENSTSASYSVEVVPEYIRRMLRTVVVLAEAGSTQDAEALLTGSAEKYSPYKALCFSNRAQVLRLAGNIQGALEDLSWVIQNETPSEVQNIPAPLARLLSDAHFHRATIYLLIVRGKI